MDNCIIVFYCVCKDFFFFWFGHDFFPNPFPWHTLIVAILLFTDPLIDNHSWMVVVSVPCHSCDNILVTVARQL